MGIVNVGKLVLTEDELILKTVNVAQKDALTGMSKGSLIFETEGIALMFYDGVDWVYAYRPYTPQIYNFSQYTFKTLVPSGSKEGPTANEFLAAYAGQEFMTEGYLTTGNHPGYQLWTVPADGTYRITAGGARGGKDTNYGIADIWGATIRGDFDLLAGDQIEMCIGSGGNQYGSPHGNEAGGGGGTFVKNNTTGNVMIVAGGGGGSAGNVYGNSCTRNLNDAYGQTTIQAASTTCQGSYTATASTAGQGGHGPDSGGSHWGGGGGGYSGDGSAGSAHCTAPNGGRSFGNGAMGGTGNHCYSPSGEGNRGGFGGGGGGNLSGPGGGGGYSGGNSSGDWSSYSQHGGGGGSINAGANQVNSRGGNSGASGGYTGAGFVTIQFL